MDGAALIVFPKINARPKEKRKLMINYAIKAETSEPGNWVIAEKDKNEESSDIFISQRIENKQNVPLYKPIPDDGIQVLETLSTRDVRQGMVRQERQKIGKNRKN